MRVRRLVQNYDAGAAPYAAPSLPATQLMALLLCFCLSLSAQSPPDRWFAEDKLLHFASSFAATTVSASLSRMAGLEAREAAFTGAAAAGVIGIAKEVHDLRSPTGSASVRDLLWDGAGIAAGTAVMLQVR